MLNKLDHWHKTKLGYLLYALLELAAAYGFASLAIDRGNFIYYIMALVFLVGSLRNLTKLIGMFINGKRKANKTR